MKSKSQNSMLLLKLNNLQSSIIFTSIYCILFLGFNALPILVYSQTTDPFGIEQLTQIENPKISNLFRKQVSAESIKQIGQIAYQIEPKQINSIRNNFNALIATEIPDGIGNNHKFIYTEFNFFTADYELNLIQENQTIKLNNIDRGIHLKGIQKNNGNSMSSLSIYENEIYGSAYNSDGLKLNITQNANPTQNNLTLDNRLYQPVFLCCNSSNQFSSFPPIRSWYCFLSS